MLDDCNFHESVSLDRFEAERMLELVPPDGEFALMQYRLAVWAPSMSAVVADQMQQRPS